MSESVRKSVLEKLANMEGGEADSLLEKEYSNLMEILTNSNEFTKLDHGLDLLSIFVHRMPEKASKDIIDFVDSVGRVDLVVPGGFVSDEYFSIEKIQVNAVGLLSQLRYLAPDTVIDGLFKFCDSEVEKIRVAADKHLGELANIDLNVFTKIGVQPQLMLLGKLETLSQVKIKQQGSTILNILREFLASNISGYRWDYKKVTISSGAIPAGDDIRTLRNRSIQLLKQIYFYDNAVSWQKQVISSLNEATSTYSQHGIDDYSLEMINNDTLVVLRFYRSLLSGADLQIVQKIEHNSYWDFYRSTSGQVSEEALKIEHEISQMEEYKIYRDLVGFEGVFVDWQESLSSSNPDRILNSEERSKRAEKWVASVNNNNFADWEKRVILFCRTESRDLATFPTFYRFMERLANLQPQSTLRLVTGRYEEIEPVLISTLRGLWNSQLRDELRQVMSDWVQKNLNIFSCCRLFRSVAEIDKELFQKITDKSIATNNTAVLTEIVLVIMDRFDQFGAEQLSSNFEATIEQLTALKDTDWASQCGFFAQKGGFPNSLTGSERKVVFTNLLQAREIDYGTEEMLEQVGKADYRGLVNFFGRRLEIEEGLGPRSDYSAIPFKFHNLDKVLSKHPDVLFSKILGWYDGNYSMFIFKGAKLLANSFPTFTDELEVELVKQVEDGNERELEVVLAVLRNYRGETSTYRVCQALVKKLPRNHKLLDGIRIALAQTGMVSGEYGFTKAFEQKAEQMKSWLQSDDLKVREFAQDFIRSLNEDAERERIRADQEIELRKFKYGVDESES